MCSSQVGTCIACIEIVSYTDKRFQTAQHERIVNSRSCTTHKLEVHWGCPCLSYIWNHKIPQWVLVDTYLWNLLHSNLHHCWSAPAEKLSLFYVGIHDGFIYAMQKQPHIPVGRPYCLWWHRYAHQSNHVWSSERRRLPVLASAAVPRRWRASSASSWWGRDRQSLLEQWWHSLPPRPPPAVWYQTASSSSTEESSHSLNQSPLPVILNS